MKRLPRTCIHIIAVTALISAMPYAGVAQEPAGTGEYSAEGVPHGPSTVTERTMDALLDVVRQAVGEATADGAKPTLRGIEKGDLVSLGGDVEVEKGQIVEGDVVVTRGSALVDGTVKGSVVVLGGSMTFGADARVEGDAVAIGGVITRAERAQVGGAIIEMTSPWVGSLIDRVTNEMGLDQEGAGTTDDDKPGTTASMPRTGSDTGRRSQGYSTFGQPIRVEADDVVEGDVASFGGSVEVLGRVTGDVGAIGAPITISGVVEGDVACVGGPITIHGTVNGDVASFGGAINLGESARVGGRISRMGGALARAPGAYVGTEGPGGPIGRIAGVRDPDASPFMVWLTLTIIGLVILVVLVQALPDQMDAVALRISAEPGRALAYGSIGLLAAGPIVLVMGFLVITVLLLPLFGALLVALALVGMVGMGIAIGRYLRERLGRPEGPLMGRALVGFVVCTALALLLSLPVVRVAAAMLLLFIFVFGFGGALMTGFGVDPEGRWMLGRRGGRPSSPAGQGPMAAYPRDDAPAVHAAPGDAMPPQSTEMGPQLASVTGDTTLEPSSDRPDAIEAPPPFDGDMSEDDATDEADRPDSPEP